MPQMKRLSIWYSERKNESWMTLSDLRSSRRSTTKEMLVSEAPCAQAITLIPFLPKVPKSLPAIPGVCFMFSPTIATVASSASEVMGNNSPVSISLLNSSFSTRQAFSASSSFTPIEVEFSEEACDTKNTLMPLSANARKMRLLIPITPTIPKPRTLMRLVSLMLEIPLMAFSEPDFPSRITVPCPSGLNVFFIKIGIFLWQTG